MSMIAAEWGSGQVLLVVPVVLPVLHLDLAADRRVQRHLPQPRPVGLGQGPVDDLHHRLAVPRRVRLPDRPRPQDERARRRGRQGPGRGVQEVRAAGRRHDRRRRAPPTSWSACTSCTSRASSTTPSTPRPRPRRSPDAASARTLGGMTVLPFGSWPTPVTSELVVRGRPRARRRRLRRRRRLVVGEPTGGGRPHRRAAAGGRRHRDRGPRRRRGTPAPPCTSTAAARGGSPAACCGSPTGRRSACTASAPTASPSR